MSALDRRTFLLGAAGAGLLTACGDDGEGDATPTTDPTATDSPSSDEGSSDGVAGVPVALVPAFPDGRRAPSPLVHSVEQRVTYVLIDDVDVMRDNAPATVTLEVLLDGAAIAGGTVTRRDQGVSTPYYSVVFTPPGPGVYTTVLDGSEEIALRHEFVVLEPAETSIPQPGDVLPGVDTGTFDDARGVDPLCTRAEPCPFHEVNLTDALAAGDKPLVVSIATPGFCQTAICGPVIDLLIDQAETRDDLHVIHAEVYVDPNNDDGIFTGTGDTTDIVDAYVLPFEPVLFVCRADGTIVRRLDAIYDGSELADALALL